MTEHRFNTAIVAAAGLGTRMGADRAKQLLEIGGVPVIIHTLKRFEECDAIHRVILVLQPDLTTTVLGLISRYGLKKISRVVAGGAERQDSVYRGLQVVNEQTAGVIAIHDAVRPFVAADEIRAVVERAESVGAAVLALPATDTVKQVRSGKIQRTLDRRRIYLAQTPQAFRFAVIKQAYGQAYADRFMGTDDSQLVERIGQRVAVVEGSPRNIKITRPLDLKLAEIIRVEFSAPESGL